MTETNAIIKVDTHDIEVTHLDKPYFPDGNITKGDLIEYYRRIAPVMLPYTKGRPISMERFPHGAGFEGFYQKVEPDYFPEWIHTVSIENFEKKVFQPEVTIENAATLVYLANQACITMHTWLSREDKLDYPDIMIIDLDPPSEDFEPVRRNAWIVKDIFDTLKLVPYLKTTGSKGLHVGVPLKREDHYEFVRHFARDIATILVATDPEHMTLNPREPGDKFFVDYLRNSRGATAVAPYSVRARKGATVATPIEWDELKDKKLNSRTYDINNIFDRLDKSGDPWKKMSSHARSLKGARVILDNMLAEIEGKKQYRR
jgi:bifunctional non-homologous end joining protein LigD